MIQNRYKYFRLTKGNAGFAFMCIVVVPSIVGYLGYTTDVSFRFVRGSGTRVAGHQVRHGHGMEWGADVGCRRACGIFVRSGGATLSLSAKSIGDGGRAWVGMAVHRLHGILWCRDQETHNHKSYQSISTG